MNKTLLQQCHVELSSLFETQTSELQAVNSYLIKIKNAIAENDVEALNNLVDEQTLPIREIDLLQAKQRQLMSSYNFQPTREGLEKCIEWCDKENTISKQYQTFKVEMEKLQLSLQVSDMLINKGQNRVRQSLHLLTGQTVNTRTYTSTGHSQESTEGRSIAHV